MVGGEEGEEKVGSKKSCAMEVDDEALGDDKERAKASAM